MVPYSTGSQQNGKIPVLFEMSLGSHQYPSTGMQPYIWLTFKLSIRGDFDGEEAWSLGILVVNAGKNKLQSITC